jgi:hypothetical protein
MLMDVFAPGDHLRIDALHARGDLGVKSGELSTATGALRGTGCGGGDEQQWEKEQAAH